MNCDRAIALARCIFPIGSWDKRFARDVAAIVETMPGHPAHRALDLLTNQVLANLGYSDGIEIFEAAVSQWHRDGLPYPLPEVLE